ncbi:hypothetical protein LVJ94_00515 [Pendulispora rubella]|uniref:Uncharacterized protein n=1 Tax=Pendulispora rubella TaxID=2741070 RepID=A0ABZ2L4S9_9BACT
MDADALHRPALTSLTPRTIAIDVIDARTPRPETSAQMVAEVTRTLEARFRSAGLQVDRTNTANKLVVTVTYKDEPMSGYEREDCVWFRGRLTSTARAWVEAEGGACFAWRHALGFHVGGDASRAYETGLSGVLEILDRSWAGLGTSSARTR